MRETFDLQNSIRPAGLKELSSPGVICASRHSHNNSTLQQHTSGRCAPTHTCTYTHPCTRAVHHVPDVEQSHRTPPLPQSFRVRVCMFARATPSLPYGNSWQACLTILHYTQRNSRRGLLKHFPRPLTLHSGLLQHTLNPPCSCSHALAGTVIKWRRPSKPWSR